MPRKKNTTTAYPMIPLRGLMVFPRMILHFDVGRFAAGGFRFLFPAGGQKQDGSSEQKQGEKNETRFHGFSPPF